MKSTSLRPTGPAPRANGSVPPLPPLSASAHSDESQWAAIVSISANIGCTAETLPRWVRRHEGHTGQREGLSSTEQARINALEHEVRVLRQAN